MDRPSATLSELVEALRDGVGYFELAAEHSHQAACIQLFQQIRRLKAGIADELVAELAACDTASDGPGTWLKAYRQACVDLPATLTSDPQPVVLAALEAQEIRLLRAFRDAVGRDRPNHVRELAATYLPEVEQARDRLHALQRGAGH